MKHPTKKKRSEYWVKIKHKKRRVVKATGYTESDNPRRVFRALITEFGDVGSGFSEHELLTIKTKLDNNEEVYIECEYQELSENNKMRFPVFIRMTNKSGVCEYGHQK